VACSHGDKVDHANLSRVRRKDMGDVLIGNVMRSGNLPTQLRAYARALNFEALNRVHR
jgi:hypothetical protein